MTQCIKANQPLRRGAFLQYTLYNTGWRDKTKPFFKMSVSNLLASIIYSPPLYVMHLSCLGSEFIFHKALSHVPKIVFFY